jgi:hypothetical protein
MAPSPSGGIRTSVSSRQRPGERGTPGLGKPGVPKPGRAGHGVYRQHRTLGDGSLRRVHHPMGRRELRCTHGGQGQTTMNERSKYRGSRQRHLEEEGSQRSDSDHSATVGGPCGPSPSKVVHAADLAVVASGACAHRPTMCAWSGAPAPIGPTDVTMAKQSGKGRATGAWEHRPTLCRYKVRHDEEGSS